MLDDLKSGFQEFKLYNDETTNKIQTENVQFGGLVRRI